MKHILLPTDFSETALNAIHYAMKFFQDDPCKFYVLNVQKTSTFISDDLMALKPSESVFESIVASAKQKIEALIADLKTQYDNKLHAFESKVDYDNFMDAVNQMIDMEHIDLVVMGTTGTSNIEKKLFGSNTIRVIQRGHCPVLAIPRDHAYTPIKDIAFSSNYLTAYQPEDLKWLLALSEQYADLVHVIHVRDTEHLTAYQEGNRAFLDELLSKVNHTFIELEHTNVLQAITTYIRENKIDLLVMLSRKHSFLERLLVRHTVEDFAFNLTAPLLVVENKGDFRMT